MFTFTDCTISIITVVTSAYKRSFGVHTFGILMTIGSSQFTFVSFCSNMKISLNIFILTCKYLRSKEIFPAMELHLFPTINWNISRRFQTLLMLAYHYKPCHFHDNQHYICTRNYPWCWYIEHYRRSCPFSLNIREYLNFKIRKKQYIYIYIITYLQKQCKGSA